MTKLYHGPEGWQVPGQQGAGAERVDVPNSPAELAAWLNDRGTPSSIDAGGDAAVAPSHAQPRVAQLTDQRNPELDEAIARSSQLARTRELAEAERKAANAAKAIDRGSAEHVAAWIFDQATPAQVEQLFTTLGTRFHELRKEAGK